MLELWHGIGRFICIGEYVDDFEEYGVGCGMAVERTDYLFEGVGGEIIVAVEEGNAFAGRYLEGLVAGVCLSAVFF